MLFPTLPFLSDAKGPADHRNVFGLFKDVGQARFHFAWSGRVSELGGQPGDNGVIVDGRIPYPDLPERASIRERLRFWGHIEPVARQPCEGPYGA